MLSDYRSAIHFVIDIETLGVKPGTPILQIGLVTVSDGTIQDVSEFKSSIESNFRYQLTGVDPITVDWWQRKHRGKFDRLLTLIEGANLNDALHGLTEACALPPEQASFFWSKHPQFDFPILEAAFEKMGQPLPWNFWQVRDIATLEDRLFIESVSKPNDHDAVNDAMNEAAVLIEAVWGNKKC